MWRRLAEECLEGVAIAVLIMYKQVVDMTYLGKSRRRLAYFWLLSNSLKLLTCHPTYPSFDQAEQRRVAWAFNNYHGNTSVRAIKDRGLPSAPHTQILEEYTDPDVEKNTK